MGNGSGILIPMSRVSEPWILESFYSLLDSFKFIIMRMRSKLLLVIIAICLSGTANHSTFAQSSTPSESFNATEANVSNPFKVTKPQNRRTAFKQRLQYNEDIGIAVPPRFSENEQVWIEYIRNNFPFNPR